MDKFDEYKFFAESTQYLTDKRQSAAQVYLGMSAGIFAALGFFVKDISLRGGALIVASSLLIVTGLLICWIWYKLIMRYKKLIGWRYDQLMAMETQIPGCHQMYVKEWKEHFEPQQGKEKFGFSVLEKRLPLLFMFLYILASLGLILATVCKWPDIG